MKTNVRVQSDREPRHSPATHRVIQYRSRDEFSDNRPEAIAQRTFADSINTSPRQMAQRKAIETIHTSPYMVAQRKQLHGLFGEAAQLKSGSEEEGLQMKAAPSVLQCQGSEEKTNKDVSGKQDDIQKKMVKVCAMYRLSLDPTDRDTAWETGVIENGLCGGWVEVFKTYPEWVEELWTALKSWDVPEDSEDVDHQELLKSLNGVINQYATRASGIKNVRGQEAFMQVIHLLREAWQAMERLEPTAGYHETPLPEYAERIRTDRAIPTDKKIVLTKTVRESKSKPGVQTAKVIQDFVTQKQKNKNQVACMVHIETPYHHMAVKIQTTFSGPTITVVETEKMGIETIHTWDKLALSLAGGLFFGNKSEEVEEVEIRLSC